MASTPVIFLGGPGSQGKNYGEFVLKMTIRVVAGSDRPVRYDEEPLRNLPSSLRSVLLSPSAFLPGGRNLPAADGVILFTGNDQ